MNEFILAEFSIFYKRLTIVEQCLKTQIIMKYEMHYPNNAYNILYRYFKTINRNNGSGVFSKIHNANKANSEKLILSINKLYLGETLNLFLNPVFLKNTIRHNFFRNNIKTNETNFQKKQKALREFRNCIAHCDEKKYSIDRTKFIDALVFFEELLECNVLIDCNLLSVVRSVRKLSTMEILSLIYSTTPSYFADDKLLILLFDDLALINGYTFSSLPKRWTIIRQKFKIEENIKNGKNVGNPLENIQTRLQF